jgi:hypothetical protein
MYQVRFYKEMLKRVGQAVGATPIAENINPVPGGSSGRF